MGLRSDDENGFSVGLSLHSRSLSIEDLEALAPLFDSSWQPPSVRPLSKRERADLPDGVGAQLHTHLIEDRCESASDNLISATKLVRSPQLLELASRDKELTVDVHAKQDLPGVGTARDVHVSQRAVEELAGIDGGGSGLDIDQYGADGVSWRLNSVLSPFFGLLPGADRKFRLSLSLDDLSAREVSIRAELTPRSTDDYEIALDSALAGLLESGAVAGSVRVGCTLELIFPAVYRYGLGLHLSQAFLASLASTGSDLTLRMRHPAPFSVESRTYGRRLPARA